MVQRLRQILRQELPKRREPLRKLRPERLAEAAVVDQDVVDQVCLHFLHFLHNNLDQCTNPNQWVHLCLRMLLRT